MKERDGRVEYVLSLSQSNTNILTCYVRYFGSWKMSPRELYLSSARMRLSDASHLIVNKSMMDMSVEPSSKGVVRATLLLGGFFITPTSPNSCLLLAVSQIDFGGWIPEFLANRL
eukprot:CAMPEP_0196591050 /NCGR_PEP_ID=MMETSP1081-20130531/68367_1 /TAXON_ID=36882 /ORGANISM="Pyramimonas amylifera, Strain CCMP720" /LENGTH=114 /DNA_ID=CAMNT_0041914303 /DNA_START=95 /DNA_END=436 /DNA_ORIENTATION=+